MHYYLVCFDIEDNRFRRLLGNRLLAYGHRVQHSVFEITLKNDGQLKQLRRSITKLQIEHQETGNIRFYRLFKPCRDASFTLDGAALMEFPGLIVV